MDENLAKAWQSGDQAKVWEMLCDFLDMSVEEFMDVQQKLLKEQIELLAQCELGRAIMGDQVPTSVEEFRRIVPLTTYEDYEPYLEEKREDVLPLKPYLWMQTGGTTRKKWVPLPDKATEAMLDTYLALFIIGSASERGRFTLRPGDTMLYSVAPPPYGSGIGYREISKMANLPILPPAEQAVQMDFQTRIARGLYLALAEGLDILLALPGIFVRIGESFVHMLKSMPAVTDPRAAARLEQATRKAKAEGRSILPKDVWEVKSLLSFGADLAAFEDKIEFYWGRKPRNFYPNTEFLCLAAVCSWKGEGMTPVLRNSFYEFIREKDFIRSQQDPSYRPPTLLLNELEENERYELLFTNFHGGALVRYRPGDFIKVISLENDEVGIRLPQIIPDGRADRIIDIAGFTRLSERVLWQALENLGIRYEGWMIRKELEDKEPVLRLYLATDETDLDRLQEEIHQSLKKFEPDYADLESMSGLKPLRLKPLPYGVFERYTELRRAAGSDPGQLKAQCMAPSDEVVETILKLAEN